MGPGHYHKMETKPIGQGARSASGRRHDLDLSVVATRQLCSPPRLDPWLAARESPQDRGLITAQPLLFDRRGIRQDSLGGTRLRREAIAIGLTGWCLVASACQRPASDQEPRGSSPARSETGKSVPRRCQDETSVPS